MTWRSPVMRVSLLLMESMWVYALAAFFVAITVGGGGPSFLAAAGVVFASFAISRGFQATELPLVLVRIWGGVLSLLLFYAIMRVFFFGDWRFWDFTWADQLFNHTEATLRDKANAVLGIPFLGLFWLRGIMRGQQYLGFESVVASFATGVVIVAFVEVFARSVDAPGGVQVIAVPYLAVGLLTIGLAHIARSDDFGRSFTPGWLLAIGAGVLAVAGFAFLVSQVDRSSASGGLETAGRDTGWVAGRTVYYTSYPIIAGSEVALRAISDIVRKAWGSQATNPCTLAGRANSEARATPAAGSTPAPAQNCQQGEAPPAQQGDAKPLPGWLKFGIRAGVATTLVALIFGAVAMLFTRSRQPREDDEVKESTYQEGRLASDISGLIGSLLGRLRPSVHIGNPGSDPVRRLYFEMLAVGAQRGVERRPPETPLELSPRLTRAFAARTPADITGLFDDVRYGARSPDEGEVRRLRDELERLRRGRRDGGPAD